MSTYGLRPQTASTEENNVLGKTIRQTSALQQTTRRR
jgi:hypothetical protein